MTERRGAEMVVGGKPGRGGFTVVEMLVVITIIAILAGLIMTGVGTARNLAKRSQAETDIVGLYKAIEEYKFKYGAYPINHSSTNENEYSYLRFDVTAARGSANYGILNVFEQVQIYSFDKARVGKDGTNEHKFLDPWDQPYVIYPSDNAPVDTLGAKADGIAHTRINLRVGATGTDEIDAYIYSYGGGDKDKNVAADWVYKK